MRPFGSNVEHLLDSGPSTSRHTRDSGLCGSEAGRENDSNQHGEEACARSVITHIDDRRSLAHDFRQLKPPIIWLVAKPPAPSIIEWRASHQIGRCLGT